MEKLNPAALAEWEDEQGANPEDIRPGVQTVDERMIAAYVIEAEELPRVSALPFATYLDREWGEYIDPDNPALTNGDVISGALAFWRGQ